MSGEEQRISTTSFASSGFSLEDSYNVQHQSPPEQPVDAAGVLVHEEDLQSEEAADVVYVADNYQVEIKHSSITASIVKNEPYAESEEILPEKEGQSDDEQQMIEEKQQVMIVVEEGMGHGNEIGIQKENDEEQHETRPAEQLEEINGRAGRPESPIVPQVTPLVQPQPRKSIVLNDSDDANKIEEPKPIRPFSLGSENAVRPQYIEEKKGQIQQQKSVESPSSEEKIMAQMRAKKNVSNLIAKFSTVSVTESNDQRNGCSKQKERLEVGVSKIDQLRQKFSQQ